MDLICVSDSAWGQQASLWDFRENVILYNQSIDFLVALLMSDKKQTKPDK